MRVLLLSPLQGIDPPCGDTVHTKILLAHPPQNVDYESYADALERGAIVEHGRRAAVAAAWAAGKGRFGETVFTGISKLINLCRRYRILFWEPFRIFSVRHGEYDAIHVHVFNCGFRNLDCPVLVSSDLPIRYVYTDARKYSLFRVQLIEKVELALAKLLGVNLTSYWVPGVQRVLVPTIFLRNWYRENVDLNVESIDQVATYLPGGGEALSHNEKPRRIGFIAKDFESKGGFVLLEAFEAVRRIKPDAELFIIGSTPRLTPEELKEKNIRWLPLVEREELMETIFPSFDVFAYPTQFDGMPLVLLEAMSLGLAISTTNYRAIPEMVDYGGAGMLSEIGDAKALSKNLLRLLDVSTNSEYRSASRGQFKKCYSSEVVRPKLEAAYRQAIDDYSRTAKVL